MTENEDLKLITCIVERGKAKKVVKAILKMKVTGATVFYARGTGVRQKLGLINRIFLNPEKEVVVTVVPEKKSNDVFDKIVEAAGLDREGRGFAYVQSVERSAGALKES